MIKSMDKKEVSPAPAAKPATLKTLAAYLHLDPTTISVVLNNVPGRSIPEPTRERIRAAARKFNYHPSLVARSLRSRRTMTIGILIPALSEPYEGEVLTGIGDYLLENDYFYFIAHHGHRANLIETYPQMLVSRGAEGLILVDTQVDHPMPVPAVALAGKRRLQGVTNVVLDHKAAAELVLKHLYDLGHCKLAFMRGQPFSSDAFPRWESTVKAAGALGLEIHPELTLQLEEDIHSPELGYRLTRQLLQHHRDFTAMVSFNDMAAAGAIRALHEAGLRVPEDVSVVGFDDIPWAGFQTPSLTTVRQPLHEMGRLSAELLLERIRSEAVGPAQVAVKPQLVARESTSVARP